MIPDDVRKAHAQKCRDCVERKFYAWTCDVHFDWLDCFYDCENDYEHWKAQQEEGKQE